MSPEISDLLKRALALSPDERAALANTLLDSLESSNESVQEAWDQEVARRIEDLKKGKAVTVPWEQGGSTKNEKPKKRKTVNRPLGTPESQAFAMVNER